MSQQPLKNLQATLVNPADIGNDAKILRKSTPNRETFPEKLNCTSTASSTALRFIAFVCSAIDFTKYSMNNVSMKRNYFSYVIFQSKSMTSDPARILQ